MRPELDNNNVERYNQQMLKFASQNKLSSLEFVQHLVSLGAYSLNEGLKRAAECGNYDLVIYFHNIGATNIEEYTHLDERYQIVG